MIDRNTNSVGSTSIFKTAKFVGPVETVVWTKNATTRAIQVDSELSKNKISAREGYYRCADKFYDSDLPRHLEEELYDESFWVRQLERLKEKDKFVRLDDIGYMCS